MEKIPKVVISEEVLVESNFMKDHKVIMYTKEEGGAFHYCIVEANKVRDIMFKWMATGELVLPVPGTPKAFNMVDIFKASSVNVLGSEQEYARVPMGGNNYE